MSKRIVRRQLAGKDIAAALDYCLSEGGDVAALGFVDSLEQALSNLARRPAVGSPRYAQELNLPGLRSWRMTRYPYLIFYQDRLDHVDVWRVLHAQRDLPEWLREPDEQ